MRTNDYSNIERFDKVIAKIKWCSFFCVTVYYQNALSTGTLSRRHCRDTLHSRSGKRVKHVDELVYEDGNTKR